MKISTELETNPFSIVLGQCLSYFFGGLPLFYAYKWIAYNFNLPTMTYLEMVCMFASLHYLCRALRKISRKD